MKQKIILALLAFVCSLPCFAQSIGFPYTYKGQTVQYFIVGTVCQTLEGDVAHGMSANNISGDLELPSEVFHPGLGWFPLKRIGSGSFYKNDALTSVIIPESVTDIGDDAFRDCTSLSILELPDSDCKIGSAAFSGCKNIKKLEFPESLTSIGRNAFSGCTGLTSLEFPESQTSIGTDAFSGCTGLTSLEFPESWITIPNAFSGCTGLTSLEFPKSLTSIYGDAFSGCTGLTSLEFPESWITIPGAFSGCTGLTSLSFPESLTSIESSAFSGCTGLTSLSFPDSLTRIGTDAFSGCTGLTSLEFPESWTTIPSAFSGCTGLTSLSFPESLTSIGTNAFSGCTGLTSLELPLSIASIGNNAFYNCSGLISLLIPNPERFKDCFGGCTALKKVAIPYDASGAPENVKIIYFAPNDVALQDGILYGLKDELKTSVLYVPVNLEGEFNCSESITSYGENAFYLCSSLTSIVIGDAVSEIGEDAFYGCNGLTEITIPKSVTSIGANAFNGLELKQLTLEHIEVPGFSNSFSDSYDSATLNVPEIAFVDYLYSSWSKFRNISDGNQVSTVATDNSLDYHIFKSTASGEVRNEAILIPGSYENLSSVDISDGITVNDERYYVTGISSKAFSGCKNLTSVTFNARTEIERIGASAFYDCTGLTKVDYPSLERLCNIDFESGSSNPLYYAHNLYINGVETKDVEIPTDIKEIKAYAFTGCSLNSAKYTSLEQLCSIDFGSRSSNPLWLAHDLYIGGKGIRKLEFPTSIKEIKAYAFAGATIYTVVIPNSVMTIGKDAFADCTELETVRFEDGATPLDLFADAFQYYKDNKTYYQVINDLYLGRNIANRTALWSKNLVIGNLVTEFYNFKDNKNLVSLTLGSGLTAIPADAFNGCSLSEVVVPVNVTEIGENAFANNNGKLTKVSMGYKLTTIGEKAFDRNTIETVNVAATTPPEASDNTFSNYKGLLYVPSGSEEEYRYAMNCWHNFARYPLVDLEKIEGSADKLSGQIGETVQLSVTLTPENLSLPYVFWRSTNPELAIVDNNGLVTIVGGYELGECKIIAETLYDTDKVATFDVKSLSAGIFEIVAEEGFEEFGGSDVERANDIFTLEGVCLKRNASKEDIDALAPGIYIVAGKKMVVK